MPEFSRKVFSRAKPLIEEKVTLKTNLEFRREVVFEKPEFDRRFSLFDYTEYHDSHQPLVEMTGGQRENIQIFILLRIVPTSTASK